MNYFLTNSHCTSQFGVIDGTIFGQPTIVRRVGAEIYDAPLFSGRGGCPTGRQCKHTDAAVIKYDAGISVRFAGIAKTSSGLTLGSPAYTINGDAGANSQFVGDIVHKVGRTTGHTSGPITNLCIDVPQYELVGGTVVDTYRTMLCQVQANFNSGSGDSGSPIYVPSSGSNVSYSGIMWGGNGTTSTYSDLFWLVAEIQGYAVPNKYLVFYH